MKQIFRSIALVLLMIGFFNAQGKNVFVNASLVGTNLIITKDNIVNESNDSEIEGQIITNWTPCTSPDVPIIAATDTIICSGNSVNLRIAIGNLNDAANWQWYRNGCGMIAVGSDSSITVSPTITTTYYIRGEGGCVSPGNCGSITITVNSVPAKPDTIMGNSIVCEGFVESYYIGPVAGAISYTWTTPSDWTDTAISISLTTDVGLASGFILVSANNNCGSSVAETLAVSVYPIPRQSGPIIGNIYVCAGSSQTYSIAPDSFATSYSWTLPNYWNGSSSTNSITAIAGSSGGVITIAAHNVCGNNNTETLAVSINPVPMQPAAIFGNGTVCRGDSITYYINPMANATSYTWTLPNGWNGSSTTDSINTIAWISGSIMVTANNVCNSSAPQSLAITVDTVPPMPGIISGNTNPCYQSSQIFSIIPVEGATDYTWTMPFDWNGTSNTASINVTVGNNAGTITVTANDHCGSSIARTMAVNSVFSPPTPGIISGNNPVCINSNVIYSIDSVSEATDYTWSLPSTWNGSSPTNTISVITGNTGGGISVIANNICGSSLPQALIVAMDSIPAMPSAIIGNNSVCENSLQTYSVDSVVGATDYTWTLPNGWTGTSTTNSINVLTDTLGGTISVIANNSCGSSMVQSLAINVVLIPLAPGSIIGNDTVCQGTNQTYRVAAVAGASSYTWTLPSGWIGTSIADTIIATVGSISGSIIVTANNFCGSSPASIFNVTVHSIPAPPSVISGLTAVCQNEAVIYNIIADSGATNYVWSYPTGSFIISGQGTTQLTMEYASIGGIISVVAENVCGSSAASFINVSLTLIPLQPTIIGFDSVCEGSTEIYIIPNDTSSTNNFWTSPPNASIIGQGTDTLTVTFGAVSGYITVFGNNTCGSSTVDSLHIQVSPNPAIPTISHVGINLVSNASTGNQWYLDSNIIPNAINAIYTPSQNGIYYVIITNSFGCTAMSGIFTLTNVGIEEISFANDFMIYPNPSSGKFIITTSICKSLNVQIVISDITGRTLITAFNAFISGKDSKEIDLRDLQPGMYFLTIKSSDEILSRKIIKE